MITSLPELPAVLAIENYSLIYIDLARAKSEALVNKTCKQRNFNRVMLNGDENENAFKTNISN